MNITDIRISKVEGEGKMKAVASVTFDDVFVVHDVKVIQGAEKLFVSMPSRKNRLGSFRDVAHPIVREFREELENVVIKAYEQMLSSLEAAVTVE